MWGVGQVVQRPRRARRQHPGPLCPLHTEPHRPLHRLPVARVPQRRLALHPRANQVPHRRACPPRAPLRPKAASRPLRVRCLPPPSPRPKLKGTGLRFEGWFCWAGKRPGSHSSALVGLWLLGTQTSKARRLVVVSR